MPDNVLLIGEIFYYRKNGTIVEQYNSGLIRSVAIPPNFLPYLDQ